MAPTEARENDYRRRMGVSGLWTLLQPVGRPVQLENMEGKRMAIDSSIWLYQFQATMRDKDGRVLVNAHVLGFLRRISKLLFYGIRPVFVFDGGAPSLKRNTIAGRKLKKAGASLDHARTAEKLLAAQMRREAVSRHVPVEMSPEEAAKKTAEDLLAGGTYLSDPLQPSTETPKTPENSSKGKAKAAVKPTSPESSTKKNLWHDHDPYRLPAIDLQAVIAKASDARTPDPRLATEDELRAFIDEMVPENFDTNSEMFHSLPTEIQYEIIGDLRLKSRQTSHARLQSMLSKTHDALDFSKAQIVNLRQRNGLTQQLLATTESVARVQQMTIPIRIASERNRQYVLIKNEGSEGGWVLGLRDDGTSAKPIEIKDEDEDHDRDDNEESDDDMEEVLPPQEYHDPDLREHTRGLLGKAAIIRQSGSVASSSKEKFSKVHNTDTSSASRGHALFLDDEEEEEDSDVLEAIQQSVEEQEAKDLQVALEASRHHEDTERMRQFQVSRTAQEAGSTYVTLMSRVSDHAAKLAAVRSSIMTEHTRSGSSVTPSTPQKQSNSTSTPTPLHPFQNASGRPRLSPLPSPMGSTTPQRLLPKSSPLDSSLSRQPSSSFPPPVESSKPSAQDPLISTPNTPSPLSRGRRALDHSNDSGVKEKEPPKMVTPPGHKRFLSSQTGSPNSFPNKKAAGQVHPPPSRTFIHPPSPPPPPDANEPSVKDDDIVTRQSNPPTTRPQTTRNLAERYESELGASRPHSTDGMDVSDDDEMEAVAPYKDPDTISVIPDLTQPIIVDGETIETVPDRVDNLNADATLVAHEESGHLEAWDAANEMDAAAEEGEFIQFMSQIKGRDLAAVRDEIDQEIKALHRQKKAAMRDSEDITHQMVVQIQLMLRLFGIPYVTAPMEAEAQCATLVSLGLVEGIITDDSDVFLFGGQRVFRNMFNQSKTVECFLLQDLSRELGLDQETLIHLAYLLGSDYTEGLPGVGPVLAMELLKEFPGRDGLKRFRDWWMKVQSGRDETEDNKSVFRKRFKKRFKDMHLTRDWPSEAVHEAYFNPTVDTSEEPFKWGLPDLDGLRDFLNAELSWSAEKVDETLLPIVRKVGQRGRPGGVNKQNTLEAFFDASIGSGTYAPRRRQAYASKRLQKVVSEFRREQKAAGQVGSSGSAEPGATSSSSSASTNDGDEPAQPPRQRRMKTAASASSKRKKAPIKMTRAMKRRAANDSDKAEGSLSEGEVRRGTEVPDRPLEVRLRPRPKRRPVPQENAQTSSATE